MSKLIAYEIYTTNPDTGDIGWDIKFVWSTAEMIESFPNFDCIITTNDCSPNETWLPDGLLKGPLS